MAGEREQMVEESDPVAVRQVEPRRVWRDLIGDLAGVVENAIDDANGDLPYGGRLDVVCEQISDHMTSTGYRQPSEDEQVLSWHATAMETHIATSALATNGKREFVHVGAQVADPVETRGRGM